MKLLDYISNLLMPFLENPIFMYVIVLVIIGTDAYFFTTAFNGFDETQVFSLPIAYCNFWNDVSGNVLMDGILLPVKNLFGVTNFCSSLELTTGIIALGVFGGLLTFILHLLGLHELVVISSAQLFFIMVFLPIISWVATHQLGKR